MNPDGTEQKSLYGSGSYFPNSTFDAKPLPGGSSQFIGVISGHHGVTRSGRLMLFDPSKSRKSEKGMLQELPFRDRKIEPIVKDRLVDGVWPQFIKPYPYVLLRQPFYLWLRSGCAHGPLLRSVRLRFPAKLFPDKLP